MTVQPFDPHNIGLRYLYEAVADHIAARIKADELPALTRLPGEKELSEEYGVSLGTARRAIELLRERGLVVTLPSKGTFVAGPD